MSSIKCPNCNLTNFETAQFCKRCNRALNQPLANHLQNQTQIFNPASNTHIRPTPTVRQNEPIKDYQNNQPNYRQGYQGNQSYQQNYQGNQYANQSYQQAQSYDYALPKFPQGQRPPQYNSYQNTPHYPVGEMPYRRMGWEVALHRNSTLPELCVKCGKNSLYDGGYVAQKFRWHHPAVYAALISPLIYVILAACLSESFTINVPLCSEHIEKREKLFTTLLVGGLMSVLFICLAVISGYFGFAFLIFIVSSVIISLNVEYSYKAFRRGKIEGSYYYLKGASDEFLNNLPY